MNADNKERTIRFEDGHEYVIIDSLYGKCNRITVEHGVDALLAPRNPITMETVLIAEYQNGKKEEFDTFPKEALYLGWVRCYTNDGRPGFLCNRQVVAAVGRAIANLDTFREEEIAVPSEEEADEIIKELGIPYPLISYDEAVRTRQDVELDWMRKWKQSGKLCYMSDVGDYEIESTIPEDRKSHIGKTGEQVKAEASTQGELPFG